MSNLTTRFKVPLTNNSMSLKTLYYEKKLAMYLLQLFSFKSHKISNLSGLIWLNANQRVDWFCDNALRRVSCHFFYVDTTVVASKQYGALKNSE